MLTIRDVGKRVVMRHVSTGELHFGVVVDGDEDFAILEMEDSARVFVDDPQMLVDTRYDVKWVYEATLDEARENLH